MVAILVVAIQSMVLKASANVTAQLVARHRFVAAEGATPPSFDYLRVAEFALYGFIQGHLNFWWQHLLEHFFPTRRQGALSYRSVLCKLVVDQTLGLLIMNTTFLVVTNSWRLRSIVLVAAVVREKVFKIIWAAWKIWPFVATLNFALVPVGWRPVVAATVGFGWNMLLTFRFASSV